MGRSILAVVVGFLFIGALSFGTDAVLRAALPDAYVDGRVTSVPLLLFISLYVGVYAVAGCYLAARLAPNRPLFHALVLGALGLLFNIAGTAAMWDTAPAWWHVLQLALVMPFAWLGGTLRERQLASQPGSVAAA